MRKRRPGQVVGVRVDAGVVARLDALAGRLSQPGRKLGRAEILRLVVAAGIEIEERDLLPRAPRGR